METEVLPVVDVRVLSQSDLDVLAAASAHAVAPRRCPEADPLPPLKIDRAVFNESAGSRKQTFSRRRLGAAASAFSDTRFGGNDEESELIAYHLRCLFSPDDPSLPPPPQTLALPAPDPDQVTTNSKGVSVDLVGLSRLVDPYEAELRKRTAGLVSESELMGFISSLGGQWVNQRTRRKFVDAAFFGNHLPSGWKLQLGLKRKDHIAWVHCFSYVSPKGQQFATCKEVSAYLMSLLGYPELKIGNIEYGSTQQHELCDDGGVNVVGVQHQIGLSMDSQSVLPDTSVTFSSHFSDSRDKDERNTDATNSFECQQCNLTFHDQSAYAQHQISFHKVRDKRRKIGNNGKFGEPVVGKDWKFEWPVCHKAFEEQSRYYGHVGAHARYQGLTPEALLAKISSGKVGSDSFAELPFSLQELTGSPEQNGKINAGKAPFQHHNCSAKHGGNSTRGIELFNSSYNINEPNQTWCTPEEIPPTTDAPSTCSYRNDMMDHADRTVLKIAPHLNDQLDCRINGFAEAIDFNNQAGRHQVFRPTSYGTANHCQHQIIDRAMATSKHTEVNTMKTRDVNLNSGQDMISFPIATANNKTSTDLNDSNRSCITGKCFGDSFSNNDGARIAVGAYNSNILTGDITERSFAQFYNNSSHIRPSISSHSSLPESSTQTASNLIKGSDVNWKSSAVNKSDANCITGSFVNRPTNNNQAIGSMFEVMGRTSNGMQHRCNDCATGCDPLASANTSQNANSLMLMQDNDNFGSMSSVVRSVGDLPISSTTRDQQCDLQLGFSGQKQQVFPGYGELRSAAAGSPQLGSMARNSSIFTRSSAAVWGHDQN